MVNGSVGVVTGRVVVVVGGSQLQAYSGQWSIAHSFVHHLSMSACPAHSFIALHFKPVVV